MSRPTRPNPVAGFGEPVSDSQSVFRALLDAFAHPGQPRAVRGPQTTPAALGPVLSAVALTLFDQDVSVWMHRGLADDPDTAEYLAFHTGALAVATCALADFVVATPESIPDLDDLASGSDESPHRSATVVLDVRDSVDHELHVAATGPGIDGTVLRSISWMSEDFLAQWVQNTKLFPRGVDVVAADKSTVVVFPRTTRLRAVRTRRMGN